MEADEKQYLLPKKVFFIKELLPKKILNLNFPIYLGPDMRSHIRGRPDEEVIAVIKAAVDFFKQHPEKNEWCVKQYRFLHFERKHNRKRLSVLLLVGSNIEFQVESYHFSHSQQREKNSWAVKLILLCYGVPIATVGKAVWKKVNQFFSDHPNKDIWMPKINNVSRVFLNFRNKKGVTITVLLGSATRDFKGRIGGGNYKWVNFALDQQGHIYAVDICGSKNKRVIADFARDSEIMDKFHGPVMCAKYVGKRVNKQYRLLNYLGMSLEQCRRADIISGEQILKVANHVLLLLNDLHSMHKLVHRDIKPDNILYNPDNQKVTVTLIDYDMIEKIDDRVINSGTDIYQCAQAGRERSCPFIDLFAFKRLFYQQAGSYYLRREMWSVSVIFSVEELNDAIHLLTRRNYSHGVILYYVAANPDRWFYYLFSKDKVENDVAIEITLENATDLWKFLHNIKDKNQLNNNKKLISLVKQKLHATASIPGNYTSEGTKKSLVEHYRIVKQSYMDDDYVKRAGLKPIMDKIEELGAPETALVAAGQSYCANPDKLLPFETVFACFILAEIVVKRHDIPLISEIFYKNSNKDWNYQFFIQHPSIALQIISLYQAGERNIKNYQSIISSVA